MGMAWTSLAVALGVLGVLTDGVEAFRRPWFQDVSSEIGIVQEDGLKYFSATVADFDRDGRLDLALSDHGTRPVNIYWSSGQRNFRREQNNPLRKSDFHGTAAADLTNSGYLDLIVTRGGGNGNSPKLPSVVEVLKGPGATGAAELRGSFGEDMNLGQESMRGRSAHTMDINQDGLVDVVYVNAEPLSGGIQHYVYRNVGNGKFMRVMDTGIERVERKYAEVVDLNSDGYLDLLFFGADVQLWLGTGTFSFRRDWNAFPDIGMVAGVSEFDCDGDGRMDVYFARGSHDGIKESEDKIFRQTFDGFEDVSAYAGLPKAGVSIHVTDGDFNNDGAVDLYVSQYGLKTWGQSNEDWLLLNDGTCKFEKVDHAAMGRRPFERGSVGHSLDFNQDGFLDLLVGVENGSWQMYQNMRPPSPTENRWLLVRVGNSSLPTRYAIGAMVKVKCRSKVFVQRVGSRGGSHSQSYLDTLHFGLGTECGERVEMVFVKYIGKEKAQGKRDVLVNQMIEIGKYYWGPERG